MWLLVHDRASVDEQKVALRAMVTLSREGPVRLERDGDLLRADGAPVLLALSGAPEVVAGLAALGATAVAVRAEPAPGDLLGAARAIAAAVTDATGATATSFATVKWERVRPTSAAEPDAVVIAAAGGATKPAGVAPKAAAADGVVAPRVQAAPGGPPQHQHAPVDAILADHSAAAATTPLRSAAAQPAAAPPPAARRDPREPAPIARATPSTDDDLPPIAREAAPVDVTELPALAPIVARRTPIATPAQRTPEPNATPAAMVALAALDAATSDVATERALEALVEAAGRAVREDDAPTVVALWRGVLRREGGARGVAARAAYLDAIERLKRPTVLRAVASAVADPALAADAATALTRAEGDGVAALVDLLSGTTADGPRRTYLDALGRLSAAIPALVRMLRDARWHVARDAAVLLGELRASIAEGPLADLLTHEDERVRRAACGALGRLGTPEAVRALRGALGDLSAPVRATAAGCLAEREGASSADTLASALDAEEDAEVQQAILAALGRLGTPDAVQRLIRAAEPDRRLFRKKPLDLRVAAVRALAEANSSAAIAALQALANDKEREVREAAVVAARDRAARARAARGRPTPAGA